MRNFILLFIFSFYSSSLIAQTFNEIQVNEVGELLDDVVSIKNKHYSFAYTSLSDSEKIQQKDRFLLGTINKFVFDRAGKRIVRTFYSPSDTINVEGKMEKQFDAFFQFIGELYVKKKDTIRNSKMLINYNINKQAAEKHFYIKGAKNQDSLISIIKNKFDKQGRLMETATFDNKGKLLEKLTYSFNQAGRKAEEAWYLGGDGFISMIPCPNSKQTWHTTDTGFHQKWIYKYDGRNREIEKIELNANKCIVRRNTINYDSLDNAIEKCSYDENGKIVEKWLGQYKGTKLALEERYDGKGSYRSRTTYKYDEAGDLIITNFDAKGMVGGSFCIKYDNKGNWVQKFEYNKGKLFSMTERMIIYLN